MKTLFPSFQQAGIWLAKPVRLLLPATLLFGATQQAYAQFPRNETFKNASAPNFTISGAARLTGTGQTGNDAVGQGYLRLTSAATDQAGSIIDNVGFDAPDGFTISFEFFAYGGSGADGFSVFLVDEAGQPASGFRIGASGGSLGYAQKTNAPASPGVSRGYIGIGIDEFGNFANPTEGRNGGPGFTPDAISIRGAGDGSSTTDYPYLTGTALNQLGFSLDVPTTRAQSGSADYRRAFIDVVPTGSGSTRTYRITVRIQHGSVVTTTVDNVTVSTPPDRLRLGFSGSTGSLTNVHEIRNLNIVQAPFANDDLAATRYDQPITINAISNDIFPGTGFQPNSLDLDFGAPGIQSTFTVSGKGTFTVDPAGQVTFQPTGNFAGTITIPYTVNDILNRTTSTSSPGNITVVVQGADVATSITGPTTANPGSRITYNVNTTNLGSITAQNVTATLQLAPRLPAGSVTPSSGSYDATTGLVTFAPVASLASGDPPIANSVTLIVPANGTITGTAVSGNSIPDPVSANNTAAITTTISGIANVSTVCATPGKDGPLTVTGTNQILNTYYAGNQTVTAGSSTISVNTTTRGATNTLAPGDVVLIMQMQGADLNTANSNAYGDGVTGGEASGNLTTNFTAGNYEYATVESIATSGSNLTITLNKGLAYGYETVDYANISGTQTGQRRFQVVRVPQYATLTFTAASTVTGPAWDGSTGGVLVLDVAGKTIFNGSGSSLSMTAKGFRGGGAKGYDGTTTASAFRNIAATTRTGAHGSKGEGTAGTPRYVYEGGTTIVNTGNEGYVNGSTAQGAPGNAGGGATSLTPTSNNGNAGGAGGANAGKGGIGGWGAGSGNNNTGSGAQASGGASFDGTSARLVMGGGGGAGSTNATIVSGTEYFSSGGIGGGIIFLRTGSVTGTASIEANGGNAPGAGTLPEGGGGGGAGGTVVLLATPPSGIAAGLDGLTVRAQGGRGGDAQTNTNSSVGPGGGGGGGFIFANSALASSSIAAGARGGTNTNSRAFGAAAGNAGSSSTTTSASIPNTIAGAGNCLPMLTVALRTETPRRNRVGAPGSAVYPAMYTLTVSNTGGIATDLTLFTSLTDNIFSFDNTFTPEVTLTLADNTSSTPTDFTVSSGGSTPSFNLATLPAGASASITFRATIAATANDNFAYQASAGVSYTNPLRALASSTIQPGGNYYSDDTSYGAAGGSNYTGTNPSNTAEDVMIARPLPVELKHFEVAAKGLNAELMWATASELQNDRFEVERSLDGRSFEQIGTVQGQGTTTRETAYRYTDGNAARVSLRPIYYRLRQVDRDGSSSYSPVRMVRFTQGAKAAIALYPNPHSGSATLDLTSLPVADYRVEILDLAGRQLGKFELKGGLQHPLDLHSLPLGSYIIRVQSAETIITLPMIRN
ncbi:Ig-like domain-containing protein [Hymenobacter norwichensis]|uniref:Ig-like domain-containing protein n=1 Tax=Hymenobacter norwichensis TaxID=223903 RepID=UPI0003B782A3|nr:Ig-like domain-containing protein [Hymenobacter norwichensis]